jgi:site-specific recombinase XerD
MYTPSKYHQMKNSTILFWLHPQRRRNLYARVTVAGKRAEISTGWRVEPRQWNTATQQATGGPDSASINAKIAEMRLRFYKATEAGAHTAESIKAAIVGPQRAHIYTSPRLTECLTAYMEANTLTPSTKNLYQAVLGHLQTFGDTRIHEITEAYSTKLCDYLTNAVGVSQATIGVYLSKINAATAYAIANNNGQYPLMPDHVLMRHKARARAKTAPIKYLSVAQVKELLSLDLQPPLDYYRDAFMIQVHTGMAYAEMQHAANEPPQVMRTITGQHRLIYNRIKTGEMAGVPIDEQQAAFICAFDYESLPTRTTYNHYLKKLGQEIGKANLTSHCARHTFGVLKLAQGYSMESVSFMMGHSRMQVTESVYALVSPDKMESEQKKALHLGII